MKKQNKRQFKAPLPDSGPRFGKKVLSDRKPNGIVYVYTYTGKNTWVRFVSYPPF